MNYPKSSLLLPIGCILVSIFLYYSAFIFLTEDVSEYKVVVGKLNSFECQQRGTVRTLLYTIDGIPPPYGLDLRSADYSCNEYSKRHSDLIGKEIQMLARGKWVYQVSFNGEEIFPLAVIIKKMQKSTRNLATFMGFLGGFGLLIALFGKQK